jgi:hypothetical protein
MKTAPIPPKHEKYFIDVSCPRGTKMCYVTRISHRMQKHEFDITCPDALFMETAPVPPEHEKYRVDILRPRDIRKHYVTHRCHQMQEHMFGTRYPDSF